MFFTFGQNSTTSQWQSRNSTSKHLSSTLIPWQPPLPALWNQGKVQKIREEIVLSRLAQMCHQPLLTCSPQWCEGGQCAHSWSPSPTGTCSEHKVPNKAFTQAVQGNNKLHFTVKDFYLPWRYGELIEKLISPHNSSLMKRIKSACKEGPPLQKSHCATLAFPFGFSKTNDYSIYFGQGQWRRNQERLRF